MNPKKFFAELKRRKVYSVAVAYLIGGWALAQGIAQVLPVFDIPIWVVRLIVLLIVLGFPVALALSWFFDLTRYGIVRTPDLDARSINTVRSVRDSGGDDSSEKSIAVLRFENRSEEKANAYFTDGIQDEILTRLSKIADLKVISRTSTQHYKSAPEVYFLMHRQWVAAIFILV